MYILYAHFFYFYFYFLNSCLTSVCNRMVKSDLSTFFSLSTDARSTDLFSFSPFLHRHGSAFGLPNFVFYYQN